MSKKIPKWATVNPWKMSFENKAILSNLVDGKWILSTKNINIIDPLNGQKVIKVPCISNLDIYKQSMQKCNLSGLHNPIKNTERYLMYGEISAKAAMELDKDYVSEFFIKSIQRVMPKSYSQAKAEVDITKKFLYNFSGDQVRFLAKGFTTPGDHQNQQSTGYRWPYGPVSLITPFNFPLEIPVLQLMGGLYMGNKVLVKNCIKTSLVIEQFIRLLHYCGMPMTDVDLLHGRNNIEKLIKDNIFRNIQFTGSSKIANHLSEITKGKVKIEDSGFDWKIIGPDILDIESIANISDNDAYNCSGQKCSAQSILFIHNEWKNTDFIDRITKLAEKRNIKDLTIGPTLSIDNKHFNEHLNDILKIHGSELLFGGKEIENHTIPSVYGSMKPTAVVVPIESFKKEFNLLTKEIFGPFQIIVFYEDINNVINVINNIEHNLTAAVVSNDLKFINKILSNTINGTTYVGSNARTTGAPQNHYFGPSGDPRGAGIGTPEAIKNVWSCHREIILDY